MSVLEKLLAPYSAAMSGTATPLDYLRQDPVYATLFPAPVAAPQGRGGGTGAPVADGLIPLAKQLERMGFDVSGLEGFQGQGPINSGHVENSLHYSGRAADINYYGDGRWGNETQALNWLNRWIQKRYDPTELIWQEPDHYDHLHLGF